MNNKNRKNFLFTDGGVIQRNPSKIGGTWAYCLVSPAGDLLYEDYDIIPASKFPANEVTNNQMELVAVVRGLQTLQRDMVAIVCSDSEITLGRVFDGYNMNNVPSWLLDELNEEKRRLHMFKQFKHVLMSGHPTKSQLELGVGKNGHPVSEWNQRADHLCTLAADEYVAQGY